METPITATQIVNFLLTGLAAGVVGGAALELVMRSITRSGWAKADMIVALGSLLTGSLENARRVGWIVHSASAVAFGMLYTLVLVAIGFTAMPASFAIGLGMGFVHGMLVSLILVWVVAENHPLKEFSQAGFAVGLSHLAGHVAYGGAVGLVVGLLPL